jgi:Na+/H+ antiporter NhaC
MAAQLARVARSARAARVATFLAGLVVFLDDYANTMIVGATMRPIADRHRISREKLAFLVDATAAPVAGIAILSTWIGVEVGLLGDLSAQLGFQRDGYTVFFDALPFRFYCLTMLAFVGMNAVSGVDFGPMRRAEQRAGQLGKLLDDDARPMVSRSLTAAEPHPAARRRAWTAVVPMVVLLGVFLGGLWLTDEGVSLAVADPTVLLSLDGWRAVLTAADSVSLLALASAEGLGVALILAILVARLPLAAVVRSLGAGLRAAAMPMAVLLLAWSLQAACKELGTGEFLADLLAERLSPWTFPALVFVVAGVASLATGTSWGTMAILIPTALPVAFRLDGGVYGPVTIVSAAAVLDGAIFGDHCSPISDTTIMSSAASACDHLAHVRTQLPYSVAVALIVLAAGYLPAGLGAAPWTSLVGGAALAALLLAVVRLVRGRQ